MFVSRGLYPNRAVVHVSHILPDSSRQQIRASISGDESLTRENVDSPGMSALGRQFIVATFDLQANICQLEFDGGQIDSQEADHDSSGNRQAAPLASDSVDRRLPALPHFFDEGVEALIGAQEVDAGTDRDARVVAAEAMGLSLADQFQRW